MKEKLCLEDFTKNVRIPQSLVNFEDEVTNEVAYSLFNQLIQKYDIGQAIAITRTRLNSLGLDLTPRKEPVKKPVVASPKPATVKQPEQPGLFGKEEDYLRYFS